MNGRDRGTEGRSLRGAQGKAGTEELAAAQGARGV